MEISFLKGIRKRSSLQFTASPINAIWIYQPTRVAVTDGKAELREETRWNRGFRVVSDMPKLRRLDRGRGYWRSMWDIRGILIHTAIQLTWKRMQKPWQRRWRTAAEPRTPFHPVTAFPDRCRQFASSGCMGSPDLTGIDIESGVPKILSVIFPISKANFITLRLAKTWDIEFNLV